MDRDRDGPNDARAAAGLLVDGLHQCAEICDEVAEVAEGALSIGQRRLDWETNRMREEEEEEEDGGGARLIPDLRGEAE